MRRVCRDDHPRRARQATMVPVHTPKMAAQVNRAQVVCYAEQKRIRDKSLIKLNNCKIDILRGKIVMRRLDTL
jgi:hypothetical protein